MNTVRQNRKWQQHLGTGDVVTKILVLTDKLGQKWVEFGLLFRRQTEFIVNLLCPGLERDGHLSIPSF